VGGDIDEPRDVHGRRKGTEAITWFHKNPALSNQYCLYCARLVGAGSQLFSDKEHLIARRMVPPDGFSDPAAFNFLFRACRNCNKEKADLEDHISAVTLLTSPGRADEAVDAAARRKAANSFDPRQKGKPIGEVRNTTTVKMGGIFTFELVSAAQLDRDKVRLLALRHIQGLFALTTSEDPRASETSKVLPPRHFGFLGHYPHRDWGNPQLLEVVRRAGSLPQIAAITTANGYFRCVLRREDPIGSPWFWALEWNKSVRLAGWIGDPQAPPPIFADLPDAGGLVTRHEGGGFTRFRRETPLGDEADLLFDLAD
jgi:hypothetical protein